MLSLKVNLLDSIPFFLLNKVSLNSYLNGFYSKLFKTSSTDCYRPQTKFAKVMFLQVSVCPHWGACVVLFGGGMHGLIQGVCMVLFGGGAWSYLGGMHGFIWGACVVLFGGHAWFYLGGMHGFIWGVCVVLFGVGVRGFFSFSGYNEIRSMSGRYASYWNAFLLLQVGTLMTSQLISQLTSHQSFANFDFIN